MKEVNITIVKLDLKHAETIATICTTGWKQTVQGLLSEEYQKKNVDFWYNHDRVCKDIASGAYSQSRLSTPKWSESLEAQWLAHMLGRFLSFMLMKAIDINWIGRRLLEALTQQQLAEGATEQWVSRATNEEFPFTRQEVLCSMRKRRHGPKPMKSRCRYDFQDH